MKRLVTPIVAGLFVMGAAFAEQDVDFQELDQDGDGQLSRTDVAQDPYLAANFSDLDADGDGYLSRDEVENATRQRDVQEASGEDEFQSEDHDRVGFEEDSRTDDQMGSETDQFERTATEDDYQAEDFERTGFEDDADAEAEDDLDNDNTADDWE